MKYHSEYGEDALVDSLGIIAAKGFYLDLGCAWPEMFSNTAFLRERGWDGLNIDGNPSYAEKWNGVAPFVCAVIADGRPARFERNGVPELSRLSDGGEEVETVDLNDLLVERRCPPIDFISCDLEGHEFAALSTLDWSKHRPKVVVSEYNTHGIGGDYRVRDMLTTLGYRVRHQTVANIIFTL